MDINFRKFFCKHLGWWDWIYKSFDCQRYEPEPPIDPPLPLRAKDYNGQLIGTSCYELLRQPLIDAEWFLREIVKAGGNATEVFPAAAWHDMWRATPYRIVKYESQMWKDEPWNPYPGYRYPVFDMEQWDAVNLGRWHSLFHIAASLNMTIIVRMHDYCSRKDNFLERHWCMWSNIQSHRWGGPMSGGPWPWPIPEKDDPLTHDRIWFYYDQLNQRIINMLKTSGAKFYLEPWNELHATKGKHYNPNAPDETTLNLLIHKWFIDNFQKYGCPPDRIIYNTQQHRRGTPEYLDHVNRAKQICSHIEHHGCASPKTMRTHTSLYGEGRQTFPNGDGVDSHAQGINDGRPGYTEPSVSQAREMGRIIKEKDLLGYIYKNRSLRFASSIRMADFSALRGLAEGMK